MKKPVITIKKFKKAVSSTSYADVCYDDAKKIVKKFKKKIDNPDFDEKKELDENEQKVLAKIIAKKWGDDAYYLYDDLTQDYDFDVWVLATN